MSKKKHIIMETPDINESIKERLKPFLISDWNILASEDLDESVKSFNQNENEIKVIDANVILWFAKGINNTIFFLKEYSLNSKTQDSKKHIDAQLPTEYLGALVVHKHKRCIFSACWHGYDFIMLDEIKIFLGPYPILKKEIKFLSQIAQTLT